MISCTLKPPSWVIRPIVIAAIGLCAGCAGLQSYRDGQADLAQGKVEAGLTKLRQAIDIEPRNVEFRRAYFAERERAVARLLRHADVATEAGSFDLARSALRQALDLDSGNVRAQAGLDKVDVSERHWRVLERALTLAQNDDLDSAIAITQQVLSENPVHARASVQLRQLSRLQADRSGRDSGLYPKLRAAYRKPASVSFTNATLLQVFDALKAASGLNYVFDKDVRTDQRMTLSVTNKPVEDLLRLTLATNQLEKRILDEDTLLIFPNTPAKLAEYREMVVRTFYLSNSDATRVGNLLRTIAKVRDVVVDEKLNLVVVRDSAEVVRLAERLIASQDMADPEVMLELEVLEVSTSRLLDLGISWPGAVSASVLGAGTVPGQLSLNELRNRSSDLVRLTLSDPIIAAQLRSQVGSANLLANPRIRVRNRQSAKILIGERVPVFTTTATANVGTSESVSYLDVGLKLDIEPTVSLDDEVSMKLALEVSNILETIRRNSGTQAYRLGTRNTSTTLRVRDGETNILAGLIQRDERRSNTGVPGLNQAPVLGRLFGAGQDSDLSTEIILLITPRIVRNINLPGVGLQEFLAGTESSMGGSPIQLGTPGPGGNPTPAGAPRPGMPQPVLTQPLPADTTLRPQLPTPLQQPFGTAPQAPAAQRPQDAPPGFTPPTLVPSSPGN